MSYTLDFITAPPIDVSDPSIITVDVITRAAPAIVLEGTALGPPGPPGPPGGPGPAGGVASVDGRTGVVTLGDKYVDVTGDTMTGSLNVPALAVGASPANAGLIRIPNNQSIFSRNAANTADLQIIGIGAGDGVNIGQSSATITLGGAGTAIGIPYVVRIGTNPATTGTIGLPNGAGGAVNFRNAANTLNLGGIYLGTNDVLEIAGAGQVTHVGGSGLSLGTNPASAGAFRLPSQQGIRWRNVANDGDGAAITTDVADHLNLTVPAAKWHRFLVGGAEVATLKDASALINTPIGVTGHVLASTFLGVGSNQATNGAIRVPNNQHMYGRNVANTGDVLMVGLSSIDQVMLGSATAVGTALSAASGGSHVFNIGGVQQAAVGVGFMSTRDDFFINAGSTVGLRIGATATQKLGHWGSTPIVRPTGWGAPTGTATRTTFATTTATVTQLAERLKALIDDLTAEGLIGA